MVSGSPVAASLTPVWPPARLAIGKLKPRGRVVCRYLLVLLLSVALVRGGETWVICAGVEKYDDPAVSALRFAAADAV